eukprot:577003-Pelagomonas_calceolata.AAC.7
MASFDVVLLRLMSSRCEHLLRPGAGLCAFPVRAFIAPRLRGDLLTGTLRHPFCRDPRKQPKRGALAKSLPPAPPHFQPEKPQVCQEYARALLNTVGRNIGAGTPAMKEKAVST